MKGQKVIVCKLSLYLAGKKPVRVWYIPVLWWPSNHPIKMDKPSDWDVLLFMWLDPFSGALKTCQHFPKGDMYTEKWTFAN